EFSELNRFIDQKLKNYSSGMQVRLAFSVAIYANKDILLMDEVLAVGDSNFQRKCLEEFQRYRKARKTVVLVSHDIDVARKFCDRILLLDKGRNIILDTADKAVNEYVKRNMIDEEKRFKKEKQSNKDDSKHTNKRGSDRDKLEITKVEFLDSSENPKQIFKTGEDIIARISYNAKEKIEKPIFGVGFYTPEGVYITGPNTQTSYFLIKKLAGKGFVDCTIIKNPFLGGTYQFTAAIFNTNGFLPYDFREREYEFTILENEKNQYGVIKLNHKWKHEKIEKPDLMVK
ncbi:MAG: Wzt carbohydrate-binding domain-containing protein, partial [Bacteroidota bacterium]|nr:Wzt carbohydrate-binding domain-containing protein [Bacteroidota bacterium]